MLQCDSPKRVSLRRNKRSQEKAMANVSWLGNKHVRLRRQYECRGYTSVISGVRRTALPVEGNKSCIWLMYRHCHAFAGCLSGRCARAGTQVYDGESGKVAYHVPGVWRGVQRKVWAGVFTMCQACTQVTTQGVGGCACHVPGMYAGV